MYLGKKQTSWKTSWVAQDLTFSKGKGTTEWHKSRKIFQAKNDFILFNKNLSVLQNKDIITEEANRPQILPTLVPFEASSHVQEDEELSSEGNANANKEGELEAAERRDESTAVLMSDDELAELLKKEEEEEQEAEDSVLQEEEVDKGKMESSEISENEKTEVEKKMLDDKPEMETEVIDGEEQTDDESEEDAEMLEKEEVVVQKISPEESQGGSVQAEVESEGPRALFEETDGSTESEIPADLDYAADSGVLQPLHIVSGRLHSLSHDIQPLPKTEVIQKIPSEKHLPATEDDFEQVAQNTEAEDNEEASEKTALLDKDSGVTAKKIDAVKKEHESDGDTEELSESTGIETGSDVSEKEEEKGKNDSHPKVKARKQKKNKRTRKHSPQGDDPHTGQEQSQQEADGSSSNDNTVQKAKRRRAGKWVKAPF